MADDLDDVRQILPGVHVELGEDLAAGERSEVRRLRARWPDGTDTSVVVKHFRTAGEGWAREAAALTSAPHDAPRALLVAEGVTPPLLVFSDLGSGGSVAEALLAADADEATRAVQRWAEAVARLHAATLGGRDRFRAELDLRAGDLPIADHAMPVAVDESVHLLEAQCARLGVEVPSGALAQLRELPRRLSADENAALSPSDTCPDNNVMVGDELALIDFEGAQWRHVAWDVAYLTVPWPSCWCSWRMPSEVSERAIERYRATIEHALPYVRTPAFRTDVAAAATGWALVSAGWFLGNALADDPPPVDPARRAPARRAMILHRLDRARRNDDLPAIAELASRLRAELAGRWGDLPLAYAPAFATD